MKKHITKKDMNSLMIIYFLALINLLFLAPSSPEVKYVPKKPSAQLVSDLKACKKEGFSKKQLTECLTERIHQRIQKKYPELEASNG